MVDAPWFMSFYLFVLGLWAGHAIEAWAWRARGDHPYMNRRESGGRLYIVRRAHPQMRIENE